MEIKRYGLTEEEIKQNAEHLRKEGLSDAEIEATVNEMNREKVLDQLYEEGAIPDNWKTIQASDTFKQLRQLMPQLHPAYIGFCLSSPNADPFLPRPDDREGGKSTDCIKCCQRLSPGVISMWWSLMAMISRLQTWK